MQVFYVYLYLILFHYIPAYFALLCRKNAGKLFYVGKMSEKINKKKAL